MWCASISQAYFRVAPVGVAELPNLSFFVDAETFNVAMALHFICSHDATYPPKSLLDREYDEDRTWRYTLVILPIRLNLSLPGAIQIRKRDEPAL